MKRILSILCVALISFSACKKGEETQPSSENNQTSTSVGNALKMKGEASVNCTAGFAIFRDGQNIHEEIGDLDGATGFYEFNLNYELQSGDDILFTLVTDAGCGPAVLKTYLYVDGTLVKSQAKACEVGGVSYTFP